MRAGVPHCNIRGRPANIVHRMGLSIARADLRQFSRECGDGWRGRHKPPRPGTAFLRGPRVGRSSRLRAGVAFEGFKLASGKLSF